MSLDETRAYVEGLERLGMRFGLDRVRALSHELGDPHLAYRTVHVVGTNGKTSTTRFIAALLREHGLKVGAYVSPHLVSLAERQLVNNTPATDDEFLGCVERVRPAAELVNASLAPGEFLTQFEVLTAAAFLYFREQGCEVAVVEAGLGGRWDATSIVDSDVQVVTSIGLEHTELLGETTLAILEEKAAVIPPRGHAIAGSLDPPVRARLAEICAERDASLMVLGEDLSLLEDPKQPAFDLYTPRALYTNLRLAVLGHYQRHNACVAIGATETFLSQELDVKSVRTALAAVRVPGRLEVMSDRPLCILDGAHNPAGMAEMVKSLDYLLDRRRVLGVVSILRDKGAMEMLGSLAPRCDILFVTQNSNPRSYAASELAELAERLDGGPKVFVDPDPQSALRSAYKLATSNQVVLVTGSLYLVADIKRSLGSRRAR
jgi:dihydrofolate synthase / folylpolyglutamate synthase